MATTTSIAEILGTSRGTSAWATWLATNTEPASVEVRAFLDRALQRLPSDILARVRKRLERSDANGVDAALHELLAYEVCASFGMEPTFEPDTRGQRPDLSIQIAGATFLADVFVTYRPTSTLQTFGGLKGYKDAGEAAKKMADRLAEKASKYARLNAPFLLFAMFGEHSVGLGDLETALYGASVDEIALDGVSRDNCHPDWHEHGILCPPSAEGPHSWLSAVVGCDWFDTLKRNAPGRRLHCTVYHHWKPRSPLPIGAFRPFCDLNWRFNESDRRFWPKLHGQANIVMSTTSDDPPKFRPYSSSSPW